MDEAESSRRDWIRSHQVTWERQPHYEHRGGSRVRTGYDVALYARHPEPGRSDPGCAECLEIHEELRRLAQDAVGAIPETSALSIAPLRPAFAIRPEANWDPEVELDLTVFQPGGVTPSDADEAQVIASFEKELRRLGARPGAWSCVR